MTKNNNKINKGEKATGNTLNEYKLPHEEDQKSWKEDIMTDELDGFETFPDEMEYKSPEFEAEASEETVRELGKLVLALAKAK